MNEITMNLAFPRFTLGLLAATVALAGPATATGSERLTTPQMDSVSAGTVAVATDATAGAFGSYGYTYTHAITRTGSSPDDGLELGLGRAAASACCGPYTAADVATGSYADGLSQSRYSVNYKLSTKYSSRALGVEVVVSDNRSRPQPPYYP